MRSQKYRFVIRLRNALLLLAAVLAVGTALAGWKAFCPAPDNPGTEQSNPPDGPSVEPPVEPVIEPFKKSFKKPFKKPYETPSEEPSAESSGSPSAEPSGNPSAQPSGSLIVDPSNKFKSTLISPAVLNTAQENTREAAL